MKLKINVSANVSITPAEFPFLCFFALHARLLFQAASIDLINLPASAGFNTIMNC